MFAEAPVSLSAGFGLYANPISAQMQMELVQICHLRNNHCSISNMLSKLGEVHVFDSVYTDIDGNTDGMIRGVFEQAIEI